MRKNTKLKVTVVALSAILILSFLAIMLLTERDEPDYPLKIKSYKNRADGVEILLGKPLLFQENENIEKKILAIYTEELLQPYKNTICISGNTCITLEDRYFKFFMGLIFDVKSFKEGVELGEISDKVWPQFRDVTSEAEEEFKKLTNDGNLRGKEKRIIRQEISEGVSDRIIDAYKMHEFNYQTFDKFSLVFIQLAILSEINSSSRRHAINKEFFDSLSKEDQGFLLDVDHFQKSKQDEINEKINLLPYFFQSVFVTNLKNKRLLKVSFNVVGYKMGRSTAYDIYPFSIDNLKLNTFSDDTVIAPKEINTFFIEGRLYSDYEIKNIHAVWGD